MVTKAIFVGSFDPLTNGHLDIIKTGSQIFDELIVAVAININKKSFIPLEYRVKLIKKVVNPIKNVKVECFDGLTADFAKNVGCTVLLRGLRNSIDFEYEKQIEQVNKTLNEYLKTVYLTTSTENSFISSSIVRELFQHNGDFSSLVPKEVYEYLKA